MDKKLLVKLMKQIRTVKQEFKTLDAKAELDLRQDGSKIDFAKDVIAMANNAVPSYLLIGLEDKTFKDMGKLVFHHTKNDLNQTLADKIDPPIGIDYQEFIIGQNEYALIKIEGTNPPYIIARDLVCKKEDKKQIKLNKGTIFVRREDRNEGIGRIELEELIKKMFVPKEFENDSEYTKTLVKERPELWEFLLTAELLQEGLKSIDRGFSDLERGLVFSKSYRITGKQFMIYMQDKIADMAKLINLFGVVINEDAVKAWGGSGISGDIFEIKHFANTIIKASQHLLEWEIDLHAVKPPESLQYIIELTKGWGYVGYKSVAIMPDKLIEMVANPNKYNQVNSIHLTFESPGNIDQLIEEIARIADIPDLWIDVP